jgi:hypothetical protein
MHLIMADPLRETRAMYLCALPYPPLPVIVNRIEDGTCMLSGVEAVTTTHALIAQCINTCAIRNDDKLNFERKARQQKIFSEFLHGLADKAFFWDDHRLYDFYCEYNHKHICTFFNENDKPDVRFKPWDYMVKGDESHQKLVEYFNGQGIIMEEKEIPDVSMLDTINILILLRNRMGRSE